MIETTILTPAELVEDKFGNHLLHAIDLSSFDVNQMPITLKVPKQSLSDSALCYPSRHAFFQDSFIFKTIIRVLHVRTLSKHLKLEEVSLFLWILVLVLRIIYLLSRCRNWTTMGWKVYLCIGGTVAILAITIGLIASSLSRLDSDESKYDIDQCQCFIWSQCFRWMRPYIYIQLYLQTLRQNIHNI